eukprot:scaffold1866_cov277-Pinguiococcus_pyrenoidosus.AAC.1
MVLQISLADITGRVSPEVMKLSAAKQGGAKQIPILNLSTIANGGADASKSSCDESARESSLTTTTSQMLHTP